MAVKETIEETLQGLIYDLASANEREAARILTRIQELKSLKKERGTT